MFREYEHSGFFSTMHEWEETVGYEACREFQRTLIRCEGGSFVAEMMCFFLSFPVIFIFPLSPNRIKILYILQIEWTSFFFPQKKDITVVWGLILCVNLTGVPSRWSGIILGVSLRVFLDEVNI